MTIRPALPKSLTLRPRRAALMLGTVAMMAMASVASAESVTWVRSLDAASLDVHSRNEGVTITLLKHLYEPLVERANDGSLLPRLATDWQMLPDDPAVWQFKIREGVTFHDGTPLTAADVVFSLQRAQDEGSGFRSYLSSVAEITAPDDYTVNVRLVGVSPIFPTNLTPIMIMSADWAAANDSLTPQAAGSTDVNYATTHENGTGRYQLRSREVDVASHLTAYDAHWSGQIPAVDDITFRVISDPSTRLAALLSGEADFVQDVPVQDVERLRETAGINLVDGPENRIIYFGYDVSSDSLMSSNVDGNPFADARVREAIALAFNRDAIHRVVMRGQSVPAGVAVPPFVDGWTPELDAYAAPDIAGATALLAEAGYPDGFSVHLDCPNDRYLNDEAICIATAGMLGQIGIDVTVAGASMAIVSPKVIGDQSDFFLLGAGVPTFDSAYLFDVLYHSKTGAYGAYNGSRLADPALDARIEALASEVDIDARSAAMTGIWQTLKDEFIVLPVHSQVLSYAMREGLSLPVHPENIPNLADMQVAQ